MSIQMLKCDCMFNVQSELNQLSVSNVHSDIEQWLHSKKYLVIMTR